VTSESYPTGHSERIVLRAAYNGDIVDLHDETTGSNTGTISDLHRELFGSFPYLTPGALPNANFNLSLPGLFEAPAGICLNGEREINTTGYLIQSAHFGDLVGKASGVLEGVLEPLSSDDNYMSADTFCGWA
jgi:hypothetical protein